MEHTNRRLILDLARLLTCFHHTNITCLGSAFTFLLHSASCTPLPLPSIIILHIFGQLQRLCTSFLFVLSSFFQQCCTRTSLRHPSTRPINIEQEPSWSRHILHQAEGSRIPSIRTASVYTKPRLHSNRFCLHHLNSRQVGIVNLPTFPRRMIMPTRTSQEPSTIQYPAHLCPGTPHKRHPVLRCPTHARCQHFPMMAQNMDMLV